MRASGALPRSSRGFTLMELAVALAATGVVAMAATMLFSLYLSLIKRARVQSELVTRGRGALEYVLNEARRAGGNGVAARDSILIESGCGSRGGFPDCHGTDRITVVQPLGGYGKCTVEAELGSRTIRVKEIRHGRFGAGECCLNEVPGFRRQVAFSSGSGVIPAVLFGTDAPCTFRYEPILDDGPVRGASIVMADVKTFYLELPDPARVGRLVMHMELDGDTSSLLHERLYLASGMLDLQGALGGDMLSVSTLTGMEHDSGVTSATTALGTAPRSFARPYLVHEATTRVAFRNAR